MRQKLLFFRLLVAFTLIVYASSVQSVLAAPSAFPLVTTTTQAVIVGDASDMTLRHNTAVGTRDYYDGPELPLQGYIEQSTGRKLRIVSEKDYDPATMPFVVFVGKTTKAQELFGSQVTKLEAQRDNGYIVSVTPRYVVLAGPGIIWAQLDFLRNYLGVDTYFPAREIGTVIPRHAQVQVPVGTRIERPAFSHRRFSTFNSWQNLNFAGNPWRFADALQFHHAIQNYITVKEFGQTHPEYFAMRDGKRIIGSTSSDPAPCISNPAVAQIVIDKVNEQFNKNPRLRCISLGQTDNGFCECPQCKAMDGPSVKVGDYSSTHSYRWFTFLNRVAREVLKTHPDRLIGVLAYQGTELPPVFRLEPNIIPFLCNTRGNWAMPGGKSFDMKVTDAWLQHAHQIGIYEYLYGLGYSTPNIYNHDLAEYLRYVKRRQPNRVTGFYAEVYSNWGLDGPKLWVTEKLLWDPNQDVDKLVHQWCNAVFGAAAVPMERYFTRLEKIRHKNGSRFAQAPGKFGLFLNPEQFLLFPQEDIAKCLADLSKARTQAKDEITRRRIAYFADAFQLTAVQSKEYAAYRHIPELMEANTPAGPLLQALLKADADAPREKSAKISATLKEGDPSQLFGGVAIDTGTKAGNQIVSAIALPAVRAGLAGGETNRTALANLAGKALKQGISPELLQSANASERISDLAQTAAKLIVAKRAAKAPVVDGILDDPCWQLQTDQPWWTYRQGLGTTANPTELALAHDGKNLYIAFKCHQSLARLPKIDGYMAPGWRYTSLEFFINRDQPKDADDYFQIIASYGGGLWEKKAGGVKEYKITEGDGFYAGEVVIDMEAVGLLPQKNRYYRVNFSRNLGAFNQVNQSWYPVSFANNDLLARGWLILE